jgi:hypothetical protein
MLLWENKDLILAYYIGGEPENFEWTLGNLGSTGLIWSLLSLVQGFPSHAPARSGTAFLVPYGKRSPEIETLDSQNILSKTGLSPSKTTHASAHVHPMQRILR